MKLSARNQIKGKIISINEGIINALVSLDAGGVVITSNITKASVHDLGLAVGQEALAVIKSTEVMIGLGKSALTVRNQIPGKIVSIQEGAVNALVKLEIAGGNAISAVITIASVKELGLAVGQDAYAVIKGTSVMIGIEE